MAQAALLVALLVAGSLAYADAHAHTAYLTSGSGNLVNAGGAQPAATCVLDVDDPGTMNLTVSGVPGVNLCTIHLLNKSTQAPV